MLATKASYGATFGNNVLIEGIDKQNKNIASRSIIFHGWSSPIGRFTSGLEITNSETGISEGFIDSYSEIMAADFENMNRQEIERTLDHLNSSLSFSKYLAGTEGCPGVPIAELGHLDPKGRKSKNVLEILREDLPGSIVFAYAGPEMLSNFF